MNESMQEALPVDSEDAFEEDPTMEEAKHTGGYDTAIPGEDAEDWGDWENWGDLGTWDVDPYRKRAARVRLEERRAATKLSQGIVDRAAIAADRWHIFRIIVSVLLFGGAAWALASAIVLLTDDSFIQQATGRLSGLDILDTADVLFVVTLLSPPILLTLLGFVLIGVAIGVSKYPIIQKSLSGISQVQQELASGFGETRPLVQVVQETINNARQTFIVQLRLSQAMFWAGMLFIAVAFFRVLILGETDWLTISLTGGAGLVSWIFSYFIAQRGNIQANLADVTQLELGLVGLAKQVTTLDRWLATFLLEPYSLDSEELRTSERSTGWALQALQRGTFAAVGLVELYAQAAEGSEDEKAERRKLLNEAAQIHAGMVTDTTRISKPELATIAGNYATVLAEAANLRTAEDLREAGASPTERQQLSDKTGIRLEAIEEFVRLADLMRLTAATSDTARLLRDAGIASMADLAKADPSALYQNLMNINTKQKLLTASPSLGDVTSWVEQAKTLPQEITY
jgi:hypothetical protein